MPTNFPKGDDGKRTSPMGAMIDAPSFAADRGEFSRILGGDEVARKFLSDPDAVTKALRDYVWSIGINGGTAPVGSSPPMQAQAPSGTPRRAASKAASGGG